METPVNSPLSTRIDLSAIDFADYRNTNNSYKGLYSGNLIQVRVGPKDIGIEPVTNHLLCMNAGVQDEERYVTDGKLRRLIWYSLRTIDPKTGEKHPAFEQENLLKKHLIF